MINDNESLRQRKKEKYHQRKYHSHHSENHPMEISCIRNQLGVFFGYIFCSWAGTALKSTVFVCLCVWVCFYCVPCMFYECFDIVRSLRSLMFTPVSVRGTWWDGCGCALGDKWITIYTMSTITPRSYRTLIKRFSRAVAGWFRPAFTRFLNPALSTDFPFFTSLVFESNQFALKDFLDFKTSSWPPVILVTAISYLHY